MFENIICIATLGSELIGRVAVDIGSPELQEDICGHDIED